MRSTFKKKTNRKFDGWQFTKDGSFDKCKGRKNKKLRRSYQRALERRHLMKETKDYLS